MDPSARFAPAPHLDDVDHVPSGTIGAGGAIAITQPGSDAGVARLGRWPRGNGHSSKLSHCNLMSAVYWQRAYPFIAPTTLSVFDAPFIRVRYRRLFAMEWNVLSDGVLFVQQATTFAGNSCSYFHSLSVWVVISH